ncbi:hypothetical protein RD792_014347 [Penstemon davidsonii]|uniref:EF-hand domain-containing protein n=1 Tax=Penstemon davidsonii TaxID=160366 RepID=A0ABR0CP33_9LAMI|nr:hypothetical protein RD792_014347 [Penstemon davidsonii]
MSGGEEMKFQMKAYKHRVVVDPEKSCKILEHAIGVIYDHNAKGFLSFEKLYRLFRHVLHMCGLFRSLPAPSGFFLNVPDLCGFF